MATKPTLSLTGGMPGVTINNAVNGLGAPAQEQQPVMQTFGNLGLDSRATAQTGVVSTSMSVPAGDSTVVSSGILATPNGGPRNVTHVNGQEVTMAGGATMVPKPGDLVQPFFMPGGDEINDVKGNGNDLPSDRRLLAHGREISEIEINLDDFMRSAGILTFSPYTISKADAKKGLAEQLEGIAREQQTTVDMLKRHNKIKPDAEPYKENERIQIPYVSIPDQMQKGRQTNDAITAVREMCRNLLEQDYIKFLFSDEQSLPFTRETCETLAQLNDQLEARQKIISSPSNTGSAEGQVAIRVKDTSLCSIQRPPCCSEKCRDRFVYMLIVVAIIGAIFLIFVDPTDLTSDPVALDVIRWTTRSSTAVSTVGGGYGYYSGREEDKRKAKEEEQRKIEKEAADRRRAKAEQERDQILAQMTSCLQHERDIRVSNMCRALIAGFEDSDPFDLEMDVESVRQGVYRSPLTTHLIALKQRAIASSLTRLPDCERVLVPKMQKFIKLTDPDLQGEALFTLFKRAVHLYHVPPGVTAVIVINNPWNKEREVMQGMRDRYIKSARERQSQRRAATAGLEFPDTQELHDVADLFPLSFGSLVPKRKVEHKQAPAKQVQQDRRPESPVAAANGLPATTAHARRASTQPVAANANGAVETAVRDPSIDSKHSPPPTTLPGQPQQSPTAGVNGVVAGTNGVLAAGNASSGSHLSIPSPESSPTGAQTSPSKKAAAKAEAPKREDTAQPSPGKKVPRSPRGTPGAARTGNARPDPRVGKWTTPTGRKETGKKE